MAQDGLGAVPGISRVQPPFSVGQPGQPAPGRSYPDPHQFDRVDLHGHSVNLQAYAQFVVDDHSDMVSIQIVDARTHEVIREIPSEEVLRIKEQLKAYVAAHARRPA